MGKNISNQLFVAFRQGDSEAANRLWSAYYPALENLCRQNIFSKMRRFENEEDIAVSAFGSVLAHMQEGDFPWIQEGRHFWGILRKVALRKVADRIQREKALKRGGGKVRGESAFGPNAGQGLAEAAIQHEATPQEHLELQQTIENVVEECDDPILEEIIVLSMHGCNQQEIALALNCSKRTVQRKVRLLRIVFQEKGLS